MPHTLSARKRLRQSLRRRERNRARQGAARTAVRQARELIEAGSLTELRKQGRLRTEGRDYVVADGDVLLVLFNV